MVRENRDRISITSAVTPDSGLYFKIKEGSRNSNDVVKLMEQLLSENHGFIYILWGNITTQKRNGVKDFLEMNNDMPITDPIPAYSRNLIWMNSSGMD